MKLVKKSQKHVMSILLLCAIAGCGTRGPETDIGDEGPVLSSRLRLPEKDPAFESIEFTEGGKVILNFSNLPQDTYGKGHLIAGEMAGGYLEEILGFRELDGGKVYELETEPAALVEAVKTGSLVFSTKERDRASTGNNVARIAEALTVPLDEIEIYEGTISGVDIVASVSEGSHLSFEPDVSMVLEIDFWQVKRLEIVAEAEMNEYLEVVVSGNGGYSFAEEISLPGPSIPFTVAIGPLPVVGEITSELIVGVEAETESAGEIVVGAEANASLQFGAVYTDADQWQPIAPEPYFRVERIGPDWSVEGDATIRVYARGEVGVELYGGALTGPSLSAEAYADGYVKYLPPPAEWEIIGGLSACAAFNVSVFDFELSNYEKELISISFPIGKGEFDIVPPVSETDSSTDEVEKDAGGHTLEQPQNDAGTVEPELDAATVDRHDANDGAALVPDSAVPDLDAGIDSGAAGTGGQGGVGGTGDTGGTGGSGGSAGTGDTGGQGGAGGSGGTGDTGGQGGEAGTGDTGGQGGSGGGCESDCPSKGAKMCVNELQARTCGEVQRGCYQWSDPYNCDSDRICDGSFGCRECGGENMVCCADDTCPRSDLLQCIGGTCK